MDPQSSSDSDFSPHRQERSRGSRLHLEVGSSLSGEALQAQGIPEPTVMGHPESWASGCVSTEQRVENSRGGGQAGLGG